jgi:hypothetical protein
VLVDEGGWRNGAVCFRYTPLRSFGGVTKELRECSSCEVTDLADGSDLLGDEEGKRDFKAGTGIAYK